MFVFAIETCGKTVALLHEVDRSKLDGFLSGDRPEGENFREHLRDAIHEGWPIWDGVSQLEVRLATKIEHDHFRSITAILWGGNAIAEESTWYFPSYRPA